VEGHDYRIQLERKQKIFHANRLKRYFPADPEVPEDTSEPSEPTELAVMKIQAVLWESEENLKERASTRGRIGNADLTTKGDYYER